MSTLELAKAKCNHTKTTLNHTLEDQFRFIMALSHVCRKIWLLMPNRFCPVPIQKGWEGELDRTPSWFWTVTLYTEQTLAAELWIPILCGCPCYNGAAIVGEVWDNGTCSQQLPQLHLPKKGSWRCALSDHVAMCLWCRGIG